MAASYDFTLPHDKDYVRFVIGDIDVVEAPILQDGEIVAILADEKNKYLAAARCGEIIMGKLGGAITKMVDNLQLMYGDSPSSSYRSHLQKLREDGANRLLADRRVFRLL